MTDESESPLLEAIANMKKNEQQAASQLRECRENCNPIELFVSTASMMMYGTPEELTDANFGMTSVMMEYLAYELYPYFNSTFDQTTNVAWRPVSAEIASTYRDALEKFTSNRLFLAQLTKAESEASGDLTSLINRISARARSVRGSAYPYQTAQRIRNILGKFDKWFDQRVGISPTRAVDVLHAAFKHEDCTFRDNVLPALGNDYQSNGCPNYGAIVWQYLPVDKPVLDPPVTNGEWQSLLSLIGLTPDIRSRMTEPVEVKNRPVYVLPDNRILVVDFSNVYDALWRAFDLTARTDQVFYNKRYQTYVANWLEEQAALHLEQFFPKDSIYRTLDYPDLTKLVKSTAELDIAVMWGGFLLLVEVKAKQFRQEGQLGDVGRLRTDLKDNVTEAFEQALRAKAYIELEQTPIFTERGTNRSLIVDKSRLHRVYIVTITLYELAALTTYLRALKPLKLFKENEYPFVIGERDFEIVANLLTSPDILLHYIEKRTALHQVNPSISGDETDMLELYLDTRFTDKQLWHKQESEFDIISCEGYSGDIDKWALYKWREIGEMSTVPLNIPEEIAATLVQLRIFPDDEYKWIAFCLLDLPYSVLQVLADGLKKAHQMRPKPGGTRRFVANGEDVAICVVVTNGYTQEGLQEKLKRRIDIEKYRRRCRKAIGFGLDAYDSRPFTVAVWQDEEWVENSEIEQLVKDDDPGIPIEGTKIPGRNDKCLCGSGKKYKKCCLPKIEKNIKSRR